MKMFQAVAATMREVEVTNKSPRSYALHAERVVELWGDLELHEITVQMVANRIRERQEQGYKPSTIRHEVAFLSRVFTWALQNGFADQNPARVARKPRVIHLEDRHLERWEESKLKRVMDPLNFQVIRFAVITTLRRVEQFSLRAEDIRWRSGYGIVREGKNGLPRKVILCPEALEIARTWLDFGGGPWVFAPHSPAGRTWDRYAAGQIFYQNVFRQAVRAAGLEGLNWRHLRHSGPTRMSQEQVPVQHIQQICGHSNINQTLRYIHNNLEPLKKAVLLI